VTGFLPVRRPIPTPRSPRRRVIVRPLTADGIRETPTIHTPMRLSHADRERARRVLDVITLEYAELGLPANQLRRGGRTMAFRVAMKEKAESLGIFVPDGFDARYPDRDPVIIVPVSESDREEPE
jgi:hypothetical protein